MLYERVKLLTTGGTWLDLWAAGDFNRCRSRDFEHEVAVRLDHVAAIEWTGERTVRDEDEPMVGVENVLTEFAEKITDSQIPDVHPTYEEAIAEYAQRLQLREVDE